MNREDTVNSCVCCFAACGLADDFSVVASEYTVAVDTRLCIVFYSTDSKIFRFSLSNSKPPLEVVSGTKMKILTVLPQNVQMNADEIRMFKHSSACTVKERENIDLCFPYPFPMFLNAGKLS